MNKIDKERMLQAKILKEKKIQEKRIQERMIQERMTQERMTQERRNKDEKRSIRRTLLSCIFALVSISVYLIYITYSYSRQIDENNIIIDQLMLTRDLLGAQVDSTGNNIIIKHLVNKKTNTPITYTQLDSLYHKYREQAEVYEILLHRAKELYQFDFSYSVTSDTITTSIWSEN